MKNKKLMLAIAGITMCATSALAFAACAHEHEYTDWQQVKAPTCMEEGAEKGTCAKDGDTKTRPIAVNPNAHAYGEWKITLPTYAAEGVAYKECGNSNEHTVEVKLPKLDETEKYKSAIPENENNPEGAVTYVYQHALGDITFTTDLSHLYKGKLTLVAAPTYDQMGYATQTCANDASHKLVIYLPKTTEKDKYQVTELTPATETKSGKAKYTFTHTDGETVEFDVTTAVTGITEDTVYDAISDIFTNKRLVGKAEGTRNGHALEYGFGGGEDRYVYIKDVADKSEHHYFLEKGESENEEVVVGVYKSDSAGRADLVDGELINLEGYRFAINSLNFQTGNYFYGIENVVEALYLKGISETDDELNGDFAQTVYTNAEDKMVYAFSFSAFKQNVSPDPEKDSIEVYDNFYKISVEFTMADGMLETADVNIAYYHFRYSIAKNEELTVPGRENIVYANNEAFARNLIKGYDTGNFFIMPDAPLNTLENIHIEQTALADIPADQRPVNNYSKENRVVNEFQLWNSRQVTKEEYDNAQESDTLKKEKLENAYYIYEILGEEDKIQGVTSAASFLKVLYVGPGGADLNFDMCQYSAVLIKDDGTTEKLDSWNSAITVYLNKQTRMFTLRCRNRVGDFKIKFIIGNAEVIKTFHVAPAVPGEISANTYSWSDEAETYLPNTVSDNVKMYVGDTMCFTSYAPPVDGCLADDGFTCTASGGTIGDFTLDGKAVKTFTASAAGTYTIRLVSTANPKKIYTITVTVVEAPTVETVLSGKYSGGGINAAFEGNNVTITDSTGTATYTVAHNDNNITLTKTGEGNNAHVYGMEITKGYNLALTYEAAGETHKALLLKEIITDAHLALAGTEWKCATRYMGELPVKFATDYKTLTVNNSEYSYKLIEAGNGKYFIKFTAKDAVPGMGLVPDKAKEDSYLIIDNNKITSMYFAIFEVGSTSLCKLTNTKPDTSEDEAKKVAELLVGQNWGFVEHNYECSYYYEFTDSSTLKAYGYEAVIDWYNYEISKTDTANKYSIKFTAKSGNMNYNGINPNSQEFGYITVKDGEITEILLNLEVTENGENKNVEAKLTKLSAEQALAGTTWVNENILLHFHDDGKTVTVSNYDSPVDEVFTYVLTKDENGKYKFTFAEKPNAGYMGLNPSVANNGSYVVYNGKVITKFVFMYGNGPEAEPSEVILNPFSLADTQWKYSFEKDGADVVVTITFDNDGTLLAELVDSSGYEETERIKYELAYDKNGEFKLTFELLNGAYGNCGIYPTTSNEGSYVQLNGGTAILNINFEAGSYKDPNAVFTQNTDDSEQTGPRK